MANHILLQTSKELLQRAALCRTVPQCATLYGHHGKGPIGNRDIVGYGVNGEYNYGDLLDFPFPAIRFRENSADILALRQKEKGDWKKLSLVDKKALYRASFCQTFAEVNAPTGDWKRILAGTLAGISLTLWAFVFLKKFVHPPLPDSFLPENKAAQLQMMIDMENNPIEGIASKYDYENNRWK